MTKRYMLAISVILCALMTTLAIAQEKATEQQKPEKVAAKAYTGVISSIDATKNEVVIKDDAGAETRLLVSTSTKITKAGKTIALADLKVGDKLTGECMDSADGCNAKLITVVPAPPSQ